MLDFRENSGFPRLALEVCARVIFDMMTVAVLLATLSPAASYLLATAPARPRATVTMADKYDTTETWSSFDTYNFGSYDRKLQAETFGLGSAHTAADVDYGVRIGPGLALPSFGAVAELALFSMKEMMDKGEAVGMPSLPERSGVRLGPGLVLPNLKVMVDKGTAVRMWAEMIGLQELAAFCVQELREKGKAVGMPSLPDLRGLQELAAFCVQELREKGKAVGMPEWRVPLPELTDEQMQELGDEWLEGCLIDAGDDEDLRAACLA